MDLSRVIIGPIVTEKTERLKGQRTYTFTVAKEANKVEIKHALDRFFDVEVESVRVLVVPPKTRVIGGDRVFTKRHAHKKVLVTLTEKSKALDLAQFRVS